MISVYQMHILCYHSVHLLDLKCQSTQQMLAVMKAKNKTHKTFKAIKKSLKTGRVNVDKFGSVYADKFSSRQTKKIRPDPTC